MTYFISVKELDVVHALKQTRICDILLCYNDLVDLVHKRGHVTMVLTVAVFVYKISQITVKTTLCHKINAYGRPAPRPWYITLNSQIQGDGINYWIIWAFAEQLYMLVHKQTAHSFTVMVILTATSMALACPCLPRGLAVFIHCACKGRGVRQVSSRQEHLQNTYKHCQDMISMVPCQRSYGRQAGTKHSRPLPVIHWQCLLPPVDYQRMVKYSR